VKHRIKQIVGALRKLALPLWIISCTTYAGFRVKAEVLENRAELRRVIDEKTSDRFTGEEGRELVARVKRLETRPTR